MLRRTHTHGRALALTLVLAALCGSASAQESLHTRIDALVETGHAGPAAPLADDGEFLRRIWLDLAGRIPPIEETRAFLADTDPEKRGKVIDKLLASPYYVRHMSNAIDVMLMERRTSPHTNAEAWQQFLYESVKGNKPYHKIAEEILRADGVDEAQRGKAKFYIDREVDPHVLTRDIGRVFFGMDMQCAQCHDHPIVDSYLQSDYYGLNAFVNRTFQWSETPVISGGKPYVADKADGEADFKSVFTEESGTTPPCLPDGEPLTEPALATTQQYEVAPADKVRPVPKYSRRMRLADEIGKGENPQFRRNAANRFWKQMMGRGLVEPVDFHHADNPPTNPELLELLASELAAMNFDIKAFLREIALTRTYQRALDLPSDFDARAAELAAQLPTLQAERDQLAAAFDAAASAASPSETSLVEAEAKLRTAMQDSQKSATAFEQAKATVAQSRDAVTNSGTQLVAKGEAVAALANAVAKLAAARSALPDDPELAAAAAVFQAKSNQYATEFTALTGGLDAQIAAVKTAVDAVPATEQASATGVAGRTAALASVEGIKQQLLPLEAQRTSARIALIRAEQRLADAKLAAEFTNQTAVASQADADPQARDAAATARDTARAELARHLSDECVARTLEPLTPEQLAWSHMVATTVATNYETATATELNQQRTMADGTNPSPAQPEEIERGSYEKLKGIVTHYVTLFGAGAGAPQEDFFATADQALFFSNNGQLDSWLVPSGSNVTARALAATDSRGAAEELYLTIFTRTPTDDESAAVATYLEARPEDRAGALKEIAWAMLTSTEFRFGH